LPGAAFFGLWKSFGYILISFDFFLNGEMSEVLRHLPGPKDEMTASNASHSGAVGAVP
jgi:hypothetical protein